ncbi:mCG1043785, partial [Mus musculus]
MSGRGGQERWKNSVFDLRSIVLLAGQGRGTEHVSQRGPGWPLNCHNLPVSASQVLGY